MLTLEIHNANLLPGMLTGYVDKTGLMDWFHKRYSERSNTAARQIRGVLFGQGNRQRIDKTTHALSLSDAYWVKEYNDDATFAHISPYFVNFWKGEGKYNNESIPTLYVNGFLHKYWQDSQTLIKQGDAREAVCSRVAKAIGINVAEVQPIEIDGEIKKVAVTNFTNADVLLESAETSGKLDAENFTTEDILTLFGQDGFDMIFIDALVGNGDRHAGNFGFLRDANTGAYLGKAPIFDFDHAYDSNNTDDYLIADALAFGTTRYKERMQNLIAACQKIELNPYMHKRLAALKAAV